MVDRLHAAIVANCWTRFLATLCSVPLLVAGLASGEEIEFRPVAIVADGITKPPNEQNPAAVRLSPDGKCLFVYRTSDRETLSIYRRDEVSGKLSRASSLGFPPVLAPNFGPVTSDSRFLFVIDSRSILWTFALSTDSGTLTQLHKVQNGKDGVIGMETIGAQCLTPDGRSLYLATSYGRRVVRFDVDAETGKLTFRECFQSAQIDVPVEGLPASVQPKRIAGARDIEGFHEASGIESSPDGRHILIASRKGNSVSIYQRDPDSNDLTYLNQIVEDKDRLVTNLRGVVNLAFHPKGTHAVACSVFGGVTLLALDRETGSLTFLEAYVDQREHFVPTPTLKMTEGLHHTTDVAWSPDGKWVFAASYGDHAIVAFRFDAENRQLIPAALLQQEQRGVKGLYGVESIAISPDGKFLYAGSRDATAAVFEIITAE